MIDQISRFSFPTQVSFGPGAVRQLSEHLGELGIVRPLVVTDPGLRDSGVWAVVENVLEESGTVFTLFSGVESNPGQANVEDALDAYRRGKCDGVIGLGGGSSLDVAKVVPVLAVNKGPLARYDVQDGGNMSIRGPLPPVIAIPTTAGTGSEVGRCSVITSESLQRKFMVCHPLMMPRMAILDPELTVGLPATITAYTGMDAFTHNLEALTVRVFHPMCDAIALKGIELVAQNLECAVKNPENLSARGYMMIAAMMGAVAFQKDLGAAHSLSHALSAVCGMQHGMANAICIVPVMRFNVEVAAAEYAMVARCFGINTFDMPQRKAAEKAIEAVAELNKRIGIPESLSQVGVQKEQLALLGKKAFEDTCHLTNPRPCTEEELFMLYKEAYEG